MPGPYRRKKSNRKYTGFGKDLKTKHRSKDLDEITEDLKPVNVESMIRQKIDYDLPGAGQSYCVHCAKHFISEKALREHLTSKPHKRRLKALEDEPYSIEESERAAGMGNYIMPKKRKVIDHDEILDELEEKASSMLEEESGTVEPKTVDSEETVVK
ncbi:zinc finger protein 593 [Galendromus occidentalis]|uniref:Zinc finger protein 593 homolog n=1 Tax=Galendromus occidentalis TaxID=34638 RepID=A0AAJ6QS13_9ACAR|nr:zinc finger protein 593 [Galendromus occidentalis]